MIKKYKIFEEFKNSKLTVYHVTGKKQKDGKTY